MSDPSIPIDLPDLVDAVRGGLSTSGRSKWYPLLPKIVIDGIEVLDVDSSVILQSCEKRFKSAAKAYELEMVKRNTAVDPRSKLATSVLDRPGVEKVYDVLSILSFSFHISAEEMNLIEPLVYHVASLMKRVDVCFTVCSDVLNKADWYITPSMMEHRVKLFTFRELVRKVMPETYKTLSDLKALADEHIHPIFVGMFFSILPKTYAYRILDAFLLEGDKTLFRYGMALLQLFKRRIKGGEFSSATELWETISSYCSSDPQFKFEDLSALAFEINKSFVDRIRKPSQFTREKISDYKMQTREALERAMAANSKIWPPRFSADVAATAASATWFNKAVWRKSVILDTPMAVRLQVYISDFMRHYGGIENLRCMYSSTVHGWSLKSMYERVGGYCPCVMLIRSRKIKAVIGVYVTSPLPPAHSTSIADRRGDHNCFVFRLDAASGKAGRYPPLSKARKAAADIATAAAAAGMDIRGFTKAKSTSNMNDVNSPYTAEKMQETVKSRYVVSNNTCLMFGASGSRSPANAIRFVRDLRMCWTSSSETFGNPCLVPEESSPFPVDCVEVFCGTDVAPGAPLPRYDSLKPTVLAAQIAADDVRAGIGGKNRGGGGGSGRGSGGGSGGSGRYTAGGIRDDDDIITPEMEQQQISYSMSDGNVDESYTYGLRALSFRKQQQQQQQEQSKSGGADAVAKSWKADLDREREIRSKYDEDLVGDTWPQGENEPILESETGLKFAPLIPAVLGAPLPDMAGMDDQDGAGGGVNNPRGAAADRRKKNLKKAKQQQSRRNKNGGDRHGNLDEYYEDEEPSVDFDGVYKTQGDGRFEQDNAEHVAALAAAGAGPDKNTKKVPGLSARVRAAQKAQIMKGGHEDDLLGVINNSGSSSGDDGSDDDSALCDDGEETGQSPRPPAKNKNYIGSRDAAGVSRGGSGGLGLQQLPIRDDINVDDIYLSNSGSKPGHDAFGAAGLSTSTGGMRGRVPSAGSHNTTNQSNDATTRASTLAGDNPLLGGDNPLRGRRPKSSSTNPNPNNNNNIKTTGTVSSTVGVVTGGGAMANFAALASAASAAAAVAVPQQHKQQQQPPSSTSHEGTLSAPTVISIATTPADHDHTTLTTERDQTLVTAVTAPAAGAIAPQPVTAAAAAPLIDTDTFEM